MRGPNVPAPGGSRAYWLEEALEHDPGEPCPALTGRLATDVCIVGGGFAGLWTAIELTEREPSMRVVLLEADICGGGASGRNGGFFSSSWWDLWGLCGLYGEEEGTRYALALADEVWAAEAWCREHGVDAWFHGEGVVGLRAGDWQAGVGDEDAVAFCARLGLADRMVPLSAEETRRYADSPRAVGGSFIRDSATVQPARLARGLRRVALERGVRIFEGTAVGRVERGHPVVVRADGAAVRADQVVITTGAWANGWPGFRRSFGTIADFMVVTEPIPDRLADIGWTTHVGIADGRELLYYLRRTEDDRIAIGGGTTGVVFGGRASGSAATSDRRAAEVAARGLLWLFPQLEGVRFTHAWGGPIDHTASFTPFFRTVRPGVHAGLGFSGHGLAQTKTGGRILAGLVLGAADEWTTMPVVGPEVAKAPPEPLRWPLVRAAVWALESGDRRESTGRRRGVLRTVVGNAPIAYRERMVRSGAGVR